MLYAIAEIFDGIDLYGYRILDSNTEKVIEYRHEDLSREVLDGRLKIENIEIDNNKAVLTGKYKDKYPKMDIENKVNDKDIIVVLERLSLISYKCTDYTGRIVYETIDKLNDEGTRLVIVNGYFKNSMEIEIKQTYEIDIDKVNYLKKKLSQYIAKVTIMGGKPLNIDIIGNEAVLFSIGDEDAEGCIIPSFVTTIWEKAFLLHDNIETVVIPESVRFIGKEAFSTCQRLKEVVMYDSEITLGAYMFYGCAKLRTIKLSNKLQEIPNGMFSYCASLTEIAIPSSVKRMGSSVFGACSNLRDVHLPVLDVIGKNTFYNCESLQEIVIPEGVKEIQKEAFVLCKSLIRVILPTTLKKIDYKAFSGIPNKVELVVHRGMGFQGVRNAVFKYI